MCNNIIKATSKFYTQKCGRYLINVKDCFVFVFYFFFWPQREVALSAPRIYSIHRDQQGHCLSSEFSLRDDGFEPGVTASVIWSTANEPTHLLNNFRKPKKITKVFKLEMKKTRNFLIILNVDLTDTYPAIFLTLSTV